MKHLGTLEQRFKINISQNTALTQGCNLKDCEHAIQSCIECALTPEQKQEHFCWWSYTKVQIFDELFFMRTPLEDLIAKIAQDLNKYESYTKQDLQKALFLTDVDFQKMFSQDECQILIDKINANKKLIPVFESDLDREKEYQEECGNIVEIVENRNGVVLYVATKKGERKEVNNMKALPISVYRSSLSDSTNHGISSRYNRLLLICDEGFIDIDEHNVPENAVVVETIHTGSNSYTFLRPYADCPKDMCGYMSGGNIGYTCDSRFPSDYPLSIHDRKETWEQYDLLSR